MKRNLHIFSNIKQTTAWMILFFLIAGILAGVLLANTLPDERYSNIQQYIYDFFYYYNRPSINQNAVFIDSLIKFARVILLIWIVGFISPGMILILSAMFFKGIAYGFTTAIIVKSYGYYGILISICAYLPQNLLYLPGCVLVAFKSLEFTLAPSAAGISRTKNRALQEHLLILVAGIVISFAAALVETWITPILLAYIAPNT